MKLNEIAYKMLRKKRYKERLEARTKKNNDEYAALEKAMFDAMIVEEMDEFKGQGYSFSPVLKPQVNVPADVKPSFIKALRAKHFGGLIKTDVNAQTLKSWYKEQVGNNGGKMPRWLKKYVNIYEVQAISVKKAGGAK